MIARLVRVDIRFGRKATLKLLLLLVGMIAMAVWGILGFERYDAALAVVVGFVLGPLLRGHLAKLVGLIPHALKVGLFCYGVVLFAGERLGLDVGTRLLVITITTVAVFQLQFWAMSDRNVYPAEE